MSQTPHNLHFQGCAPITEYVRSSSKSGNQVINTLVHRSLGRVDYQETLDAMRDFTHRRTSESADEIWLLEHPPVFTQGQAGKPEHILRYTDIPVIPSDRGGQVTYHGPGQLIAYVLVDLRRLGLGIRELVVQLEQSVITVLSGYGIQAEGRREAPGVYVDGRKIAALGLRVRKGCTYHGVSLNVSPDLTPFSCINPCGWAGQPVTSLAELGVETSIEDAGLKLFEQMSTAFG